MRLRNKKTHEIKNVNHNHILVHFNDGETKCIGSLAELNKDWEDYEEPKDTNYWYIDDFGRVQFSSEVMDEIGGSPNSWIARKLFGNYFETKEEAEKAMEKLKAWSRLKEAGFRFIDWELDMKTVADGKIWFDVGTNTEWDAERLLKLKPEVKESLDKLFGDEE